MNNFFKNIKKYLAIYIIASVILIVLVCYAFNFRTAPKDSEKVGIVVGKFNSGLVKEDFNIPENIREFNFQEVDGNLFYMTVEAKAAVNNVDILIVNSEELLNFLDILVEISKDFVDENFNDVAFYTYDSKIYGLDLSKINKDRIDSDKLYVCFVKSSLHLGSLNNSEDDAAIYIMKDFINK